ncbi:MAG: ATP-binding protein, partial [Saprospiraceae bacterium]
ISTIFEDSESNMWFGTFYSGLAKLDSKNSAVETFPELSKKLANIYIYSIIEDRNGIIWITTRGAGLVRLNPKTKDFRFYDDTSSGELKEVFQSNFLGPIIEDQTGILWIGEARSLIAFNPATEVTKVYEHQPNKPNSFPGNYSFSLHEDAQGTIWIGFDDIGLYRLDKTTETFTKVPYFSENLFDPDAFGVMSLHTQKDLLWIGTGNGLFKYHLSKQIATQYTAADGLANNNVYSILEDESNNLWMSTNNGLSRLNPTTNSFKNYDFKDGLQQLEFNQSAACRRLKDGTLYFGGQGYNFFQPAKIIENLTIPAIQFSSIKKYGSLGNFVAIKGINYLEEIVFDYSEKDFLVEIAALNFINPEKNQYAYWLEGYNDDWVQLGTKRAINFTNLSSGNYTLKVKGSNDDGLWNEQGKSIEVKILAPWWATWWAYGLYSLLLIAGGYFIYKYRKNKLETQRLKELEAVKSKMYTNVTHEFRTPLTIISGINNELKEHFKGQQKVQFEMIERNSKTMLHLVNQLLELRKIETNTPEFNFIQANIVNYLKYIVESFHSYAKTRAITFHFICTTKEILMDYDPDKVLIILSNLLSNAVKYTPNGGNIYLQVQQAEKQLEIQVIDNGRGIPQKDVPYIFDQFYKVDNLDETQMEGMGVGLALTKTLVQQLEGVISVDSQIGEGSVFKVLLPIHQKSPVQTTSPALIPTSIVKQLEEVTNHRIETSEGVPSFNKLPTLLIIEDNKDIVHYLKACVKGKYFPIIAHNGKNGVEKAIETIPDIIISDLMMPIMNGYEVLDVLKNDRRTSHIPMIMLTAKIDEAARIEGFQKGADAYISKPFNKTELLIRLNKLIELRQQLQQRYATVETLNATTDPSIQIEDEFIHQIKKLVIKHSENQNYSIAQLCRDLGIGRTQLHNKIKALTGMSTSIFMRSIRIKKGKYLLENSDKTVAEIAYEVGFNDPNYFTRCFTEEFGVSPSQVRNR